MEINHTDEPDLPLSQHAQAPPEQARWDELQEYVGSSDDEPASQDYLLDLPEYGFWGGLLSRSQVYLPSDDGRVSQGRLYQDPSPRRPQQATQDRHHGQAQDCPQQMLDFRSFQWASLERFESTIAEPSVGTYDDDDDVQWWHYFVGESRNDWDEIRVIALIAFMVFVCFFGAVMMWTMVN